MDVSKSIIQTKLGFDPSGNPIEKVERIDALKRSTTTDKFIDPNEPMKVCAQCMQKRYIIDFPEPIPNHPNWISICKWCNHVEEFTNQMFKRKGVLFREVGFDASHLMTQPVTMEQIEEEYKN